MRFLNQKVPVRLTSGSLPDRCIFFSRAVPWKNTPPAQGKSIILPRTPPVLRVPIMEPLAARFGRPNVRRSRRELPTNIAEAPIAIERKRIGTFPGATCPPCTAYIPVISTRAMWRIVLAIPGRREIIFVDCFFVNQWLSDIFGLNRHRQSDGYNGRQRQRSRTHAVPLHAGRTLRSMNAFLFCSRTVKITRHHFPFCQILGDLSRSFFCRVA